MSAPSQPLAGLRILDLTQYVAGPFATRLLAAYGAEVLKIERPGGDPARRARSTLDGARPMGPSTRFLYLNTGKRSVTLDLQTPSGRAHLLSLAQRADAVVENFAPRVLPALGLDWSVLHAVNPRLVLTSISNFGQTGPQRDWLGTNLTLFAAGGQMALTGEPDRAPLVNAGTQALLQAGLHGFAATVTAVFGARTAGRGRWVEISIQEVQAAALEGQGPAALVHGMESGRAGNRLNALWGIYPCADGFVGCSCLERNVPNLLRAIGRDDLLADPQFRDPAWRLAHDDDVVAILLEFFMAHTKQELLAIAQRFRVPFGFIASLEDLLAWPALAEKGFWREVAGPDAGRLRYPGPPFTLDGGGFDLTPAPPHPAPLADTGAAHWAPVPVGERADQPEDVGVPAAGASATPLPLAGVRIVDLTMVWAGPYATRLLADMGADVIKVEGVTNIDLVRGIGSAVAGGPERPWDRSPYFNEYNRGKRGITLDLSRPDGRRALLELVSVADALIENYRADVLDQLGLGVDVLHAVRPDLVVVSMPGFAKAGSERAMVGYGPTIEQMGGLVELNGYADGPAQKTGISYGDPVAGIVAAGALVTALLRRLRSGEGGVIEVSQRDTMIGLIGEAVLDVQRAGQAWPRRGNRHAWMAPHGCYACLPLAEADGRPVGRLGAQIGVATDRWITLAVATEQQWHALCAVLGRPDLVDDPRFASNDARRMQQDELDALVAAWAREQTDDGAAAALQAHGVPAFAVRTPLSLTQDAHLAARGFYREVEHPVAGRHRVAGPLWNLSAPRVALRTSGPAFGQHNAAVLGDLLGLAQRTLSHYEAEGIIARAPQQRALAV
jgi:crotonobetainyl-CoA:carnitine CoA-transferase CaiB-like acyl-CoA transferase